jgi:hypothetical protein
MQRFCTIGKICYWSYWRQPFCIARFSTGTTTAPPGKTALTEPTEHMFNILYSGKSKGYPSREKIFKLLNDMKQTTNVEQKSSCVERINKPQRFSFRSEEEAESTLRKAATEELRYPQNGALTAVVSPVFRRTYIQLGNKSAWRLLSVLQSLCRCELQGNDVGERAIEQGIRTLWTLSWKRRDIESLSLLSSLIKEKQPFRVVDFERLIQYHCRIDSNTRVDILGRGKDEHKETVVDQIRQLYWKLAEQFPHSSKLHTLYFYFCQHMLPPPRGRDEIESVLSCNRFSFSLETFRILFRFVVSTEEQFLRYLNVASRHKLVVHRPGFCTCVVDAVFRLYDKSATDKERLKWLQWIHHYLERQVNKGMSVPKQAIENTMYRLAIRGQVKASLHLFWFLKSCWMSVPEKHVLRILLIASSRNSLPTCQYQVNEIWKLLMDKSEGGKLASTKDQKLYIYACGMSKQLDKLYSLLHSIPKESTQLHMALIHALLWNDCKEDALQLWKQLDSSNARFIGCFLMPPRSILWMLSNNEIRTLLDRCYSMEIFLQRLAEHPLFLQRDVAFRKHVVHWLIRLWYLLDSVGLHGMKDCSFRWMFSELEYCRRHELYSRTSLCPNGRMYDYNYVKLLVERGLDELADRLDMFVCISKV